MRLARNAAIADGRLDGAAYSVYRYDADSGGVSVVLLPPCGDATRKGNDTAGYATGCVGGDLTIQVIGGRALITSRGR